GTFGRDKEAAWPTSPQISIGCSPTGRSWSASALRPPLAFQPWNLLTPYEHGAPAGRAELARHGLTQLGINTPGGREGECGLAALPGREREWHAAFARALDYAVAIAARSVHCLAGCVPPEKRAAETVFIANLARAAEDAAKAGIMLLIEPLN